MIKEYKITENTDKFLFHGRIYQKNGMAGVSWTDSGIEFCFSGCGVDFSFGELVSDQALYICVVLDGTRTKYSMTTGREHIVIDGLEDTVHRLNFVRLNSDGAGILYMDTVTIEGKEPLILRAPAEAELKIEFYGDSITCGYGNLGYDGPGFLAHRSDGMKTYAYLTCEKLGAEGRYMGFSGQGIVHAWGGAKGVPFGEFYCRTARTLEEKWDFSLWTPDVVVINGGTNDASTGAEHDEFCAKAKELILSLRKEYPEALIIWLYGMMGKPLDSMISEVISELSETDKGLRYLTTEAHYSNPDEKGGNGHPGVKCHERVSEELAAYIKKELNSK